VKRCLIFCLSALLFGGFLALGDAQAPGELRFDRLNREYSDVAPEIQPVVEGPVTVRLSAPRSTLVVRNHLLRLEPGSGGSHSADLRLEFAGRGWLVADVDVGGVSTRLQDEVTVPPQAVALQGRVRLRKVEQGYWVTFEQLPERVRVRIESGVGRRIVEVCDGVSALPLTALDCPSLERSLSRAVVPLPAAGESFLLENSELTPAERQRLDGYLRSAGA
jgi:hypothetical protein